MNKLSLIPAVLILALGACSTAERKTGGPIGCPQDQARGIETDPGFRIQNTTYRAGCRRDKAGYLGREALAIEKKQNFDDFLENLEEPKSSRE